MQAVQNVRVPANITHGGGGGGVGDNNSSQNDEISFRGPAAGERLWGDATHPIRNNRPTVKTKRQG